MAVIDIFMYNGEREILDLHLNVLAPFVDTFIICESKFTYSGNLKPLHFFQQQRYFKPFWRKIQTYMTTNVYSQDEVEHAIRHPATGGKSYWVREFLQREEFHRALNEINPSDDDTIIMGDVDEILDPHVSLESETPIKAKLRVYSYYLNNRSNELFYGIPIAQYNDIKGKSINDVRNNRDNLSEEYMGWHFTNMGGEEKLRHKIESNGHVELNTPQIKDQIANNIRANKDYIGRDFKLGKDETDLPEYILKNRPKFAKMLL